MKTVFPSNSGTGGQTKDIKGDKVSPQMPPIDYVSLTIRTDNWNQILTSLKIKKGKSFTTQEINAILTESFKLFEEFNLYLEELSWVCFELSNHFYKLPKAVKDKNYSLQGALEAGVELAYYIRQIPRAGSKERQYFWGFFGRVREYVETSDTTTDV